MLITYSHPSTLTPGAINTIGEGRLEKKFILNLDINNEIGIKNGIKSYEEYLQYYNNGENRGKTRLYNKINLLKDKLIQIYGKYVDPIHYIIKLYYGDKLPIQDVGIRLNQLGWGNKDNTSIEKTFKQTFGWELRDNIGSEISRKKRNFDNQIENAKTVNDEINQKKYQIIKNFFINRIEGILNAKTSHFDYEGFEKLNKTGKILYILYFFYGINRNEIQKFKKEGIGARVLSNYINNDLEALLEKLNINLTIFPKDIQAILNEY